MGIQARAFPTLYGLSKTGKVKQWSIKAVENEDGTGSIITSTGYIDGKIRDIEKVISEGKNIGKSNETDPFGQAISEAQSQWNKKRDKNYEIEMIDPENHRPRVMLPMLASTMKKGKIKIPCFIQPKLNGVCNLSEYQGKDNPILHHSRGGKLFETVGHLDKWIKELNPPAPLHGELYVHGWPLQHIGSYTKELKEDAHLLEYWIYDIAMMNVPFSRRWEWIMSHVGRLPQEDCPIKLTPTLLINTHEQISYYHDKWVENGFEGAILKNKLGLYMFEFRSPDIEKVKNFQDDEFEIIGGKQGTGLDEGCIIYRCKTKDGNEFDVRPKGTVEKRKEMFNNLSTELGKMLTVRFAEYSVDGTPLQPVGITVRDYE